MIAPAVLMGRLRPLALPRGTVNGEVGPCVTYALCFFVGQMLLDYQGYRWTINRIGTHRPVPKQSYHGPSMRSSNVTMYGFDLCRAWQQTKSTNIIFQFVSAIL